MPDPLNDPAVQAARSRVSTVERKRKRERFAEPTAEITAPSTATMRIFGRIDADGAPWGISASDVAQSLDALPEGTQRLDVHIHSYGGDAFEGLAILNLLRQSSAEVHVTVDGIAASAASAIAMAGKTITMAPQSTLMIHDASGLGLGQAADMRILADALDSVSQSYADAYAAKAGGSAADWRAAMQPESWFRADEAVAARLADSVLTGEAPSAPQASYDLSIFAYAGRENAPAPKTPADQPVTPPTEHKETDKMPDIPTAGLVKALGLPDDADEDTILEAVEAKVKADAALAKAQADLAEAQAKAPTAGSVVVDAQQWDDVKAMAAKGAQASARQLAEDRDATIAKAINDGKLSRNEENVAKLKADWDADPELTAKRIADMAVLYPVSAPKGHQADLEVKAEVMSDDEAEMLAQLSGTTKEALIHG